MRFRNFRIWRGRLPHWRADDVAYYVTFRHRRELDEWERIRLFRTLQHGHGRHWDLWALSVRPLETELIFVMIAGANGQVRELSDVIEKAKTKSGKLIIKRTGERFDPFYRESFDRIVRDSGELEETLARMAESSEAADAMSTALFAEDRFSIDL